MQALPLELVENKGQVRQPVEVVVGQVLLHENIPIHCLLQKKQNPIWTIKNNINNVRSKRREIDSIGIIILPGSEICRCERSIVSDFGQLRQTSG